MPEERQEDEGSPGGQPRGQHKRRARERRRSVDPGRLLLAKLLSTFLGLLAGFFIASAVSSGYVTPFQKIIDDAVGEIELAQLTIERIEPQYVQANKEYLRLWDQLYPGGKVPGASTAGQPITNSDEDPRSVEPANVDLGQAAQGEGGQQEGTLDPQTPTVDSRQSPVQSSEELRMLKEKRDKLLLALNTQRDTIELLGTLNVENQRHIRNLEYLIIALVTIATFLGYLLYPFTLELLDRASRHWQSLHPGPEPRTTQAIIGVFAGLVLAVIVVLGVFNFTQGPTLNYPILRLLFGTFVVLILGGAGALVGVLYFGPPREPEDLYKEFRFASPPKILDTSVIIDARVPDIATAGFLPGILVVTNSVLRELQSLADSADERKRGKGRRGLELVRRMQEDPRLPIRVFDDSEIESSARGTDEQLIIVASEMDGVVVTNDYNLNRVAAIRDVRVININELVNAVKTRHLPGDLLEIQIMDRGKQKGQGVGYLDDGTMVVVEDGEPFIGETRVIKLTSVTQTVQGRLIFGRVDAAEEDEARHG
ncbi:TRAM domain-containing protein [bacterium]|nr:TRAM domain-containing protein [bacterium]